jgi:hypothetical protein
MTRFYDLLGEMHTLDLDRITLDGLPILDLTTDWTNLVRIETAKSTIDCQLVSFWTDVAGGLLSPAESSVLLVQALALHLVARRQSTILGQIQHLFGQQEVVPPVLPGLLWLTTRLSPLARQAMAAYDGSSTMTEAIAKITKQDVATVLVWARQLGLFVPPVQSDKQPASSTPSLEVVVLGAPESQKVQELVVAVPSVFPVLPIPYDAPGAAPSANGNGRFSWTLERCQALDTALAECPPGSVPVQARMIAETTGLPADKVMSRLYQLRAASRSAEQPTARESQVSNDAETEED